MPTCRVAANRYNPFPASALVSLQPDSIALIIIVSNCKYIPVVSEVNNITRLVEGLQDSKIIIIKMYFILVCNS